MATPPDVARVSDELPITKRSNWSGALADESFGIGSYEVKNVDRKWNSSRSSSFLSFQASRTTGGYGYSLSSGDAKLEGACATEQQEASQDLGSGVSYEQLKAKLGCGCQDAQGKASLTLEASTTEHYAGTVVGTGYSLHISAITERENGKMPSHDPLGYRVDGEGPIGAVGVVRPGRVWLSKALDERTRRELACLFAGLMLYQPREDR